MSDEVTKLRSALKGIDPVGYINARSFHEALIRPGTADGEVLSTSSGVATWQSLQIDSYALQGSAATFGPADSTTYYFGGLPTLAPAASSPSRQLYIPKGGVIKSAHVHSFAATVAGSNEAWSLYVRLNSASDTLIATTSVAAAQRTFSNEGLSIAVVAGDYIEFKMVCPAWGTNPTNVYFQGTVYIEPA